MRVLFVGSCAKEPDRPDTNEDAYAISVDRQRLALSDGASESYDSQSWAQLLTCKLAEDPSFDQDWIQSVVEAYQGRHDFGAMSWSQQLSFERGCFATLLGVQFDAASCRLRILGIGDSVAVLVVGSEIVHAWPLDHPDRFKERPTLLSTLWTHNGFTKAADFEARACSELDLTTFPDSTLLCMTDALAEWALRVAGNAPERFADLMAVRSEEDLTTLVVSEREAKRMRVDDSTLAIIKFDIGEDANGLPHT